MAQLFSPLYAGARRLRGSQPTMWHLSYSQGSNPNRRGLCGKRAYINDERVIHTLEDLLKVLSPPNEELFGGSNVLCGMCDKASPWPTIAQS